MENKNSHFMIELTLPEIQKEDESQKKLENALTLVLSGMESDEKPYQFYKKDNRQIVVFFRTNKRKRNGQLIKLCQKNFLNEQNYQTQGLSKQFYLNEIQRFKRQPEYTIKTYAEPTQEYRYRGLDIDLFRDRKKWYPWQKEVYQKLFEEEDKIKKPHLRYIYILIDLEGNSGKSSFFKWILYNHSQEVGQTNYESLSQLRSSLINIGPKKIYIIDLARSDLKNEKENNLLAVLEELKSGIVLNNNYENVTPLLMEPPHILVYSNSVLNYKLLKKDKWQIYQMKSCKTLAPLNELITKEETKELVTA